MAEDSPEDLVVEDEIWENQRWDGSNGVWVAAEERGRFSDRFGRFKFDSLDSVPVPKNSRVLEDWRSIRPYEVWNYARTFTALEGDVAKGIVRTEKKWNSMVRWRRYVRKRKLDQPSAEILAGWLGSKERRGTWKSRYFVLLGGNAASVVAGSSNHTTGFESEDESSNDEFDDAEEGDDDSKIYSSVVHAGEEDGSPSGTGLVESRPPPPNSPVEMARSLENRPSGLTELKTGEENSQAPVMIYFRRSFNDLRTIFPGSFDLNELRNFSKKQVRILKLSGRIRVDDSLWSAEHPGRFTVKVSATRKRVFNAMSPEIRERWVDTLRAMIEGGSFEGLTSPSGKRHNPLSAAFRAAKRGQQELRKGFGGLRRGSQSGNAPPIILSTMITSTPLAFPMNSPSAGPGCLLSSSVVPPVSLPPSVMVSDQPSTFTVDLLRSPPQGSLNLRLREVAGNGLVVEQIHEQARDAHTGLFPMNIKPGDIIVAVQGEPVTGLEKGRAMRKLKEVISKFPITEKVVLTLRRQQATVTKSPRLSSTKHQQALSNLTRADSSSGCDQHSQGLSEPKDASANAEMLERNSSSAHHDGSSPNELRALSHEQEVILQKSSQQKQAVEVPKNSSITTAQARDATLSCLDQMIKSGPVTYAQLRREVARHFGMEEEMDCDAWRIFFRNLLDYGICDGVKYAVGGLDMTDFTPVIIRLSAE